MDCYKFGSLVNGCMQCCKIFSRKWMNGSLQAHLFCEWMNVLLQVLLSREWIKELLLFFIKYFNELKKVMFSDE